jgi:hypothetical protein
LPSRQVIPAGDRDHQGRDGKARKGPPECVDSGARKLLEVWIENKKRS